MDIFVIQRRVWLCICEIGETSFRNIVIQRRVWLCICKPNKNESTN